MPITTTLASRKSSPRHPDRTATNSSTERPRIEGSGSGLLLARFAQALVGRVPGAGADLRHLRREAPHRVSEALAKLGLREGNEGILRANGRLAHGANLLDRHVRGDRPIRALATFPRCS